MAKTIIIFIVIIIVAAAGTGGYWVWHKSQKTTITASPVQPAESSMENQINNNQNDSQPVFKISSTSFGNNDVLPVKFTCDGTNVNPEINIEGVPANAQGLALVVNDPDAPAGNFIHWLVWNIPASTQKIAENSTPGKSVVGVNGFGKNKYSGPCPPRGSSHRYIFTLYALDRALDIPGSSNSINAATTNHIIAKARLTAVYKRE
ncbi:MAG: YbhB/YbcL family Raf kinase inhibitor-like protein [Patescibacteria group bacterium]|nr:YbhB/YbcL family Raf kinase inhibitor-like protein [Patescibacteria group bacterium]